jgi:elongation factor Ts
MTTITAAMVKELRERTNSGMMECKKALVDASGDIEKAIEMMRKAGQAKAVKKAGRTAAEGTIVVLSSPDGKQAALVDVNCETDFVAREERFKQFAKNVGEITLQKKISTVEALQQAIENERLELVSALGENIAIRRMAFVEVSEGIVGAYGHGDSNGVRIGSLIALKKGSPEMARDLAMHIAAMNPEYLISQDVPAERIEKEKEIFIAQIREEGKPEEMVEKIVAGKVKKFSTEVTLLGQSFVKDPSKTIEAVLKAEGVEVVSFVRFEVGEGIEKKQENFATEVMAQVKSGQ